MINSLAQEVNVLQINQPIFAIWSYEKYDQTFCSSQGRIKRVTKMLSAFRFTVHTVFIAAAFMILYAGKFQISFFFLLLLCRNHQYQQVFTESMWSPWV